MKVVESGAKSLPELLEAPEFQKKYRPFRKLGEGGMGVVHKAIEIATGKHVAIKSLLFEGHPELTQRFIKEGQLLAKMRHQHIVRLHEVGIEGAHHYMVFELVDGVTLAEELDRSQQLPVKRSLEIIEQVLKGLEYAHSRGIIHRDIKPENTLLTKFGYVKIADFGLAKAYDLDLPDRDMEEPEEFAGPPAPRDPPEDPSLGNSQSTLVVSGLHAAPERKAIGKTLGGTSKRAHSGAIVGTPSYMSPEQAQGKPVNHLTDIYATGIMLWELLAGRCLYKSDDIQETLFKQIHEVPEPVSRINSKAPGYLDEIVARAIAKNPLDRYQTASEFGAAIAVAIRQLEGASAAPAQGLPLELPTVPLMSVRAVSKSSIRAATVPAQAHARASRPWPRIALAAAAVLLVAVGVLLLTKHL
ncbi:MAG: serine/threonine protein kinase [Candidatus Wallbacteria bacterium]|nr:serine/threonine protein kinase [Candidatus Wallbacteria bacterium]